MIVIGLAAALLMGPASPTIQPPTQQVQYGVPRHPPPCGHGWDLSARDGMCYPNGYLPPQEMDAYRRGYQRGGGYYRGGRYPVPCGHGPAGHFKFLRVWSVKFLHPRGRTRDC
ncbi:hypothetical protein ABIF93_002886 [Bradyrhizobium japonicum]